jgi:plastocyanin
MPPAAVLVATALALALPAAGCGGTPAEDARGGRVAVALDDFSIAPQRIAARPGRLRVAVANRGRINHTLVVVRDGREAGRTAPSLKPGARGALTVDLRAGEYRMICVIGNHEELGMSGTLTVR